MADFENAVLYVDKHGDEIHTELLRCILNEVSAKATLIDGFVHDQATDGHFPASTPSLAANANAAHSAGGHANETMTMLGTDYNITEPDIASQVEATCRRLEFLRYLLVDRTNPAARKAVNWLAWSARTVTPHSTLSHRSAYLDLLRAWTIHLWSSDALFEDTGLPESLAREDHVALTFETLTYAAALATGHEQDTILSHLFASLDDMRVHHLTLLINTLVDASVSPDHKLLAGAADRLELLQAVDGSFEGGPDDPQTNQTETTLLALRALLRCERFESHPFFN